MSVLNVREEGEVVVVVVVVGCCWLLLLLLVVVVVGGRKESWNKKCLACFKTVAGLQNIYRLQSLKVRLATTTFSGKQWFMQNICTVMSLPGRPKPKI